MFRSLLPAGLLIVLAAACAAPQGGGEPGSSAGSRPRGRIPSQWAANVKAEPTPAVGSPTVAVGSPTAAAETPGDEPQAAAPASEPAVEPQTAQAAAVPPATAAAAPQAPDSAARGSLSGAELAIWDDPEFQKRFAESYLAETEIEPRVTAVERDQILEVMDLIAADEIEEAMELLGKNCGAASSAAFDFTLANIFFQKEEYDHAAAGYEVAVEKFPKYRRAWRNLGVIRVRQSEFEKAIEAFTRVIELGGGDGIMYGLLGFAYANVEDNIAAESAYRMAILLDPRTLDWKMGLARSFFRQERYADAAALCGTLIAAHPGRADLWLLQANAYVGLDQPLKAAENFEFVDGLGQATPDSLNMLGDIYVNEELYGPAVGSYLRAMEMTPQADVQRAIRAAKVLTARGALDGARELIGHIESRHGDALDTGARKDLLRLRARVAVAEGAGEEEARVLEEIVALDPLDGEALILLGQYCRRTGDPEKAVFYFERAASLEEFEADAKVRHAQLLVGQGRYAEALPLLRRAQELKPRENIQEYMQQVERVAQAR